METKIITINDILNIEETKILYIVPYHRKTYYLKNGYYLFNAFNGSFGNCQNITINYFKYIIQALKTFEELKVLLKYITNNNDGRRIIVADIEQEDFKILLNIINSQEIIDEIFIMKNEYISTNEHNMVLIMIDTSKL